jgi:RNA polymerase sigma factor (sigma-70 family)
MKFSSASQRPEFIPTRDTLLSRLKDMDDEQSWRRFFDTYWKFIYSVAIKAGLKDCEAQEAVQETIISVARHIQTFRYDPKICTFKTWLMRVTKSRISNQFRKRGKTALEIQSEEPDEDGTALLERIPDSRSDPPDASWDREWEKNLIDAAIARAKKRIPSEQFQLFDFNVLRDWPAAKVAETFGISTARVHLAKHRVSRVIREEARLIEKEFS